MRLFGRKIQVIWWLDRPRFTVWTYPHFDMQRAVPHWPSKYFTGYDFGIVEIRVWWKGWEE